MKVLLTGATGYIGKRLLPALVEAGHQVICCVRDRKRFTVPESLIPHIEVVEMDLLNRTSLEKIPQDIEAAYYLVHSMSSSSDYQELEARSATNFKEALAETTVHQVIYLSGMVNDDVLSPHLASRKQVEDILETGDYHLTTLRAGIIIGSGSASFEIIRELAEKLPVMVAPRWLNTRSQPIAVQDVKNMLIACLHNPKVYDQHFDIGGPDILTYKEMLLEFANVRRLKRWIFVVPVMTPRLSSYWLYFVTSTSYKLAMALVDSMKVEVVAKDDRINHLLRIYPMTYREALSRAFRRVKQNNITSSWKDSYVSSDVDFNISDFVEVPTFGCFIDNRKRPYIDREKALEKIWRLGGQNGYYYGNWLWKIRGYLDKLVGGVGLRRGRTSPDQIQAGDALDFWRVLYADKDEGRLLLFAEMKLPGEAWLEFRMEKDQVVQTATFRPLGLMGRLYWYSVLPFHGFIFKNMLKAICQ
jgi:uncharacterized protein YbjT (DUF2867 family)